MDGSRQESALGQTDLQRHSLWQPPPGTVSPEVEAFIRVFHSNISEALKHSDKKSLPISLRTNGLPYKPCNSETTSSFAQRTRDQQLSSRMATATTKKRSGSYRTGSFTQNWMAILLFSTMRKSARLLNPWKLEESSTRRQRRT